MQLPIICRCTHDRIDAAELDILSIEGGSAGEDHVTYVCPSCGEDHTSVVLDSFIEDGNDVEAAAESACQCYA